LDDAQVTVAVMSFVLLSEKVPVAVNCTDELIGSVGFAGVTAIDFSVGPLRVNVAVTICAVAGIPNAHVVLPLSQMALQLVNAEPAAAVAVSVTSVPTVTFAVHPFAEPLTQLIPLPVTVPAPVPAVCTVNNTAATVVTLMAPDVPVIDAVTVSVAAIVWLPKVLSVAVKLPTPSVSVEFTGNTAPSSLLVKCTLPAYPAAVAFEAVNAVTVKLIGVPGAAVAGAVTEKCVAAVDALSMTVESEAFAGAEPPPVTPAVFTWGDVASAATFTVAVITG
jgi:hypothetical protein